MFSRFTIHDSFLLHLRQILIFRLKENRPLISKTGSRYELDENNSPIQNSEYQDAIKRVVALPDFYSFVEQIMEITSTLTQDWDEPNLQPKNQKIFEKLEPYRQRLEQEFGITDRRLQHAVLNYDNLIRLKLQKESDEEGKETSCLTMDSVIERALKKEGIFFLEASDTTTSKEFWEAHFTENPAKKPSKIVYYKGQNPTNALLQWRKENGINKRSEDRHMGFLERHVAREAPQATVGMDRFRTIAEKVIEDYFTQKSAIPE